MEDERVAEGPVVAVKRSQCPWSEVALLICKDSNKKEGKGE